MNPIESVTHCLKNYFNGKGRASRSEFWWFASLYYGSLFLAGDSPAAIFLILVLVVPFWNAGFRRLHDVGVRGWFMVIPIANIILLASTGDSTENKFGPPPTN